MASHDQAATVGKPFSRVVALLPEEQVTVSTPCAHHPGSFLWRDGELYLTTQRLIWTPLRPVTDRSTWKWLRLLPVKRDKPVTINRKQVTDVLTEDPRTSHSPTPWILKTAAKDYLFAFASGPSGLENRDEWVSRIKQWANI
jgi:hypothetical protein